MTSVRPVGTAANPTVEADLVVGPYDLTYRKRWLGGPAETQLVVRSPRPEAVSGDEAHERAVEILAANADLDLWRALRLLQGREVQQASVEAIGSLGAALERAAGGADPAEEGSLFARVEAEGRPVLHRDRAAARARVRPAGEGRDRRHVRRCAASARTATPSRRTPTDSPA